MPAATPRLSLAAPLRTRAGSSRTFAAAAASPALLLQQGAAQRQHRQQRRWQRQRQQCFHSARRLDVVKPFLLADIGEGITECQLIQWFVQPGARVEQFDKLCEVQSDKASVEITSPFDGVVKKLYYEPDDMAITGKPLLDIDIESEISPADEAKLAGGEEEGGEAKEEKQEQEEETNEDAAEEAQKDGEAKKGAAREESQPRRPPSKGDKGSLATPAVRHLIKEHDLQIEDIEGTGKDGRVLKEDVQRHMQQGSQQQQSSGSTAPTQPTPTTSREDRKVSLTPVQNQMFKTMTKSLNIPHFLYSTSADMTAVTTLRQKLNATTHSNPEQKLTHLPFILKAVSLALQHHPLLNAHLDTSDAKKPVLTHKGAHHFGVAIDAPAGLLVPVVKNVQDLSIGELAIALRTISQKARDNKLGPSDFGGATFTVSNIGSVGGGVVAPVISAPQVAILGVGRSRIVPAFDANDELVKREEVVLSWSADHRVVDGAECARCAERVKGYMEEPGAMLAALR